MRAYSFEVRSSVAMGTAAFLLGVLTMLSWPAPVAAGHSPCLALHDAAFMDEPEIVRDLLNAGVGVDCKNTDGHTPLITAVDGASEDTIRLLLSYGADANALNAFGETPLQRAREQLSWFDAEKPERYAQLFINVIADLQRAGGVEKAVRVAKPASSEAAGQ